MINQAISTYKPLVNEWSARYIDNFSRDLVKPQIIRRGILTDHNNINPITIIGIIIHL